MNRLMTTVAFSLTIFGIHGAYACDAYKACNDLDYCMYKNLTPQNIWRQALSDAARDGDLNGIVADANACQAAVGSAGDWANNSGGCGPGLADIAKKAYKQTCGALVAPPPPPSPPKQYCYTQGKYYEIGYLGPPGTGICEAMSSGSCNCGGVSPGQIVKR